MSEADLRRFVTRDDMKTTVIYERMTLRVGFGVKEGIDMIKHHLGMSFGIEALENVTFPLDEEDEESQVVDGLYV